MFGLGVLLLIVSIACCVAMQHPAPFFFGATLAFVSLFFAGYRGVFVGFVTVIGVIFLGIVIVCGSMAMHS
jgi:hypothetical protein